jgi:hypothetical protein
VVGPATNIYIGNARRREINEEENCMGGGELFDGGGPGADILWASGD